MRTRSAKIEPRNVAAIMPRAWERPVVSDLAIGESADQQIPLSHVGKGSLGIQGRAGKGIEHRILEIWRVLIPEVEYLLAVMVLFRIPILRISTQVIRKLLP